jgi:predicted AlkP superfamily pyrophosphatase or phosphodiesterase
MKRRHITGSILLAGALALTACRPGPVVPDSFTPTVILVSIDGFRWDYFERPAMVNLRRLAANGVRAEGIVPAFPTKTFPNHYTMVTGLYPDHHGIVANNMWDPVLQARFGMRIQEAIADGRWWGGEPIWVTAIRQGQRAGIMFWPGSEAEIKEIRPTYVVPYDGNIQDAARVDTVLSWLSLPADHRPSFLALYISAIDDAGHRFGANSAELNDGLVQVDRVLGRLMNGLEVRGLRDRVDVIITADHGMANTSPDRVIIIDDYIDLSAIRVVDWSPVIAIAPPADRVDEVYRQLAHAHPNLRVYKKEDVPAYLHFGSHPRVPAIIGIADEGWSIASRQRFEERPEWFAGATHGYDHTLESMKGIFVADGPSFKDGAVVPSFKNIHLYALMSHILGLEPAPNDGSIDSVRTLLRVAGIPASRH